jgi:hypothetical protein
MDLFEQFQKTLTKNINKVVENSNKRRKERAPHTRSFYWYGSFTIYSIIDDLFVDIQLREDSEEMYQNSSFFIHLPLKTLLDDSLLETYMSKI